MHSITKFLPICLLLVLGPISVARASWAMRLFEAQAAANTDNRDNTQGQGLSASASLSSSSPSSSGLQSFLGATGGQQGSQQQAATTLEQQLASLTPSQLLEYLVNPVQSTVKYVLPNTYQGLGNDMNNGYATLSSGATKGYSGLQSQLSSLGDQAMSGYSSLMSNTNRYLSSDEIMRRLYEMVANPQQMCGQLADQGQSALGSVQQQAGQSGQQATSLFNKLGTFSFGRR